MDKNSKIMIAGAGVAGLTCSIWLGRSGFRPVVIEKSPVIRADGYIISLSHKSYHYAKELDILQEMCNRNTGIRHSSYHNRSGRAMLTLDYRDLFADVDIVQLMRDELENILYKEAQDKAEFRFNLSARVINQDGGKVQVEFNNSEQEEFDLLIGADGLHSITRELVFTDDEVNKIYLDRFSAAYMLDNVVGLEDKFENHMEKDRYMCAYTTGKGGLACVFVWEDRDRQAPEPSQRPAKLRAKFRDSPEFVQKILAQCPEDKPIYMDPLIQINMQHWSKGRVVLTGDAAHCLTLLSGQGASSAFWGASALSKALIEMEPEQAFRAYEEELMPIINKIQPATRKATSWYVPAHTLKYYLRNTIMTCMPNAFFQYYFKKKYTTA